MTRSSKKRRDGPQRQGGVTPHPLDVRWIRLQQVVAIGEIAVFAGIMLLVRGRFIPPLAMASMLFAAGAAVTLRAARAGAITVGLVSTLWLGLNLAFASQVVPDLLAIQVTEIFLPTFAMNVLAAAGVVGLAGSLRRAGGTVAAVTRNVALGLVLLGAVASVLARVL